MYLTYLSPNKYIQRLSGNRITYCGLTGGIPGVWNHSFQSTWSNISFYETSLQNISFEKKLTCKSIGSNNILDKAIPLNISHACRSSTIISYYKFDLFITPPTLFIPNFVFIDIVVMAKQGCKHSLFTILLTKHIIYKSRILLNRCSWDHTLSLKNLYKNVFQSLVSIDLNLNSSM